MKLYRDTETGGTVTESELMKEFRKLQQASPDEYAYTFAEYVRNCTDKNGFLQEVNTICQNCARLGTDCGGTFCPTWTGCIFRDARKTTL